MLDDAPLVADDQMQKMLIILYCGFILRGARGVIIGACFPHSQFLNICPPRLLSGQYLSDEIAVCAVWT